MCESARLLFFDRLPTKPEQRQTVACLQNQQLGRCFLQIPGRVHAFDLPATDRTLPPRGESATVFVSSGGAYARGNETERSQPHAPGPSPEPAARQRLLNPNDSATVTLSHPVTLCVTPSVTAQSFASTGTWVVLSRCHTHINREKDLFYLVFLPPILRFSKPPRDTVTDGSKCA